MKQALKVALLATVLFACFPVTGATNDVPLDLLNRFEARRSRDRAGNTLHYRLFRPGDYAATKPYPLVLLLHGAAGLGEDNVRQFNGGNKVPPLAFTSSENQTRYPCFVMAPQCPRHDGWQSSGRRPTTTTRLTIEALDSLMGEFNIDSNRVYLVGLSMGGGAVWDWLARFPGRFAAAVPICGVGLPAGAKECARVPVWCFHGSADALVGVSSARRMIAALRKAGGNPKYTEYPGVGHNSYVNAFREPDLMPWLFRQEGAVTRLAPNRR